MFGAVSGKCIILLSLVSAIVSAALGDEIIMNMTTVNIRNVLNDFAHEISRIQSETIHNISCGTPVPDFVSAFLETSVKEPTSATPSSQDKENSYCEEPKATGGEVLLHNCEGPEITFEVIPAKCIEIDGKPKEFECTPPRFEYTRKESVCTSSYREPLVFIDRECKLVKRLGVEKELILGSGKANIHLKLGNQKIGSQPDSEPSEFTDIIRGLFSH